MRALLRAAANPHRVFPSVLVAGTNGKGSTSATIASIFSAAGYRAALYTSPHLLKLNERWQIDGHSIGNDELLSHISRLRQIVRQSSIEPTYFEALTMIAFLYFAERQCEAAVLEVGMGGRLDATNVVNPLAAVITPVGFDHTEYLGRKLSSIAREKGGIIHRGCVAITSNRDPQVVDVLRRRANQLDVTLHEVAAETTAASVKSLSDGFRFTLRTPRDRYVLTTPLSGRHQVENVSLAVRSVELLQESLPRLSRGAIVEGVRTTVWRGRLERVVVNDKVVWVDGAHNAHGAERLADFIRFLPRPRTLVFGIMADKDWTAVTDVLFPLFDAGILTEPDDARALPANMLKHQAGELRLPAVVRKGPVEALKLALSRDPQTIVVCGSLYVAGSVLTFLDRRKR